ncbi:hypothetical protein [Zongyangia hominis]|nr:hypothetical protein [Zongyangia hominis]
MTGPGVSGLATYINAGLIAKGEPIDLFELNNYAPSIIQQQGASSVSLRAGYFYLMSYTFFSATSAESYIQVINRVNGVIHPYFTSKIPTTAAGGLSSTAQSTTAIAVTAEPYVIDFVTSSPSDLRGADFHLTIMAFAIDTGD